MRSQVDYLALLRAAIRARDEAFDALKVALPVGCTVEWREPGWPIRAAVVYEVLPAYALAREVDSESFEHAVRTDWITTIEALPALDGRPASSPSAVPGGEGEPFLPIRARDPREILVWHWEDAPEELRDLSDHGGDEDWVASLPLNMKDDAIQWMEEGRAGFGVHEVSEHEHRGRLIRIGAHA